MGETLQISTGRKLGAALVTVLVIAGLIVLADHLKAQPTAAVATTTTPTTGSTSASSSSYKDGTYSASEDYFVPPGQESIQVSLTLSGGVVTDAQVTNSENDPTSSVVQQDFAASYKTQVVGKSISSLRLFNIAGASDTTQAFNDALSQIRSEAQG